ncbi:Lysyl-tRNA synthetase [Propionibacterium freudenreichii subsp. freudenreichii]|uniref:Lysine--tRNA ligase n=2 Tax=Propionibacterium freudenreichii TaxID=1744 RepID=D7GI10_PROFC|nr:Lysyl-tRNA synthetase [Propionibacterium freudenreichii subsp. shermanii CIRM-BIA1]CEH01006.1 Lysyl-tRNA synthetase [Propionibacterium freudenreichii]CEP25685.1 Lysyl-tRNA synthetase [Propionibacterium freudenreichii subsp. freudenreichii]CEH09422.1 Lysyl-tRNA synthetase [Propionibacterium freudenreichii]CEI21977.1 Lysyl-tRNA synthetase [Propionibacterium freudenreichii]
MSEQRPEKAPQSRGNQSAGKQSGGNQSRKNEPRKNGAADVEQDLPEQMRIRAEKRQRFLDEGKQAYPVDLRRDHTLAEVRATWGHLAAGEETQDEVTIGGRVIFIRNSGKLCFATLQDGFTPDQDAERLQIMLSKAEVGDESLAAWKADVDLGDFVWVRGRVIASKRGELSVMASEWKLASKALRPLPTLHNDLSEEARVRQRYNDLIVRPAARTMVRQRALITRKIRETLEEQGYLEVETPVLQSVHGGAAARPFTTHLNAFDIDMYLRIALELHLKRVMVGGADRVYEMGRVFRNEGVDSSHSPEFTMLEAYQSWGDQFTIAETLKSIIMKVAEALDIFEIPTDQGVIDLKGEWIWLPVYEGLSGEVGEEITTKTPVEHLRHIADAHKVDYDASWIDQKMVLHLFEELVEKGLTQPTFVCDFPEIAQPLARRHRSKPGCIEAWDLIIGGMERGTGFSELIDPVIQREILTQQSLAAAAGDPEAMQLDEDFLNALEQGCPPMGGLGLGVDRLVMLFTGAGIRETILFPLLRPLN